MTRHLNPFRKLVEAGMAIYGVGYGLFIIWVIELGLGNPLWWVGFDIDEQNAFALTLIFAGFLHSMGIAINGKWRWSPALRAMGMSIHAGATTYLIVSMLGSLGPHGVPSGLYPYSVTAGIFWFLALKGCQDLYHSITLSRIFL